MLPKPQKKRKDSQYYAPFKWISFLACSLLFVQINSAQCNAGNVAPALDASQPTEFCDVVTADLNDYVTNTAPAGSVLTWSLDSDITNTAAFIDSNVVAAASYFGFFYSRSHSFYSPHLGIHPWPHSGFWKWPHWYCYGLRFPWLA